MDVLVARIPSTVKFKHSCSFRHRHQQANIIEVWQYSHEWLVWCWSISRWAGFSPKPHSLLVSYFWSGKVHIIPTKNGFIVNGQDWSSNKFDNNSKDTFFQMCIDFLSIVLWYNWINLFKHFCAFFATFHMDFPKVCSLFKDCKQTAGCTNFCTETRLGKPVSVQNCVQPANIFRFRRNFSL